MFLRFEGVNPGPQIRAKSESGFEDVSRSICMDFGAILVSIWDPKIDKNRTKNQANFGIDFGLEKKGRLGTGTTAGIRNDAKEAGRTECARLLEA